MSDIPLNIPKASMAVTEATFLGWLVPDGSQVAEGEEIYSIETEKAQVDVEAPAAGVLRYGDVAEEQTYPVGTQIGSIESA